MKKRNLKKPIALLAILCLIAIVVQAYAFSMIASEKRENKRQEAYIYGQSMANAIELTLDNCVNSTESIKYFYSIYGEDCFDIFPTLAEQIVEDNQMIASAYIAPKGVIKVAYPEEVNASTIGFEMLLDPEQGPRARLAVDTQKVTVAGPHELVEGGKGLIIRNPFFENGEFIGFSIVVIDWDKFVIEVLKNTSITSEKYKFAVWKQDHDETAVTDEDGYILRNTKDDVSKDVDIEFDVPNDTWHLVVEPLDGWSVFNEMRNQVILSVLISTFIIISVIILYAYRQRKYLLDEKIKENKEKEKYMAQLSEALKKAEEANAAKTNFLNNMSHDIRTPMNAILGFTTIMEKELDNPEKIKDYLGKIKISGDYLLTLINNMLELARIDSGEESVDESFTDLLDPNCSVYPLLENEIKKKNIIFTNEMNIQHRYIFADMNKIREITMNIMSNAIKYTPDGGSIYLSFTEIPSNKEGYATYVNTISDTGIGMSDEFKEHIFDSFSREHNSTMSKVIGSGLGMAIVKKLVILLDGEIEVESELGKGSSFKIILTHRIVDNPESYLEEQQKAISIQNIDFSGKRILLAEDNDLNAEIAITLLEDTGVSVERAVDGVECINMISEKDAGYYDIIIMDVQMPNLNGYDAARRIRKLTDASKANIPIVAMTANAFEEDKKEALNAGMNEHLAKPVNMNEVLKVLVRYLIK